MKMASFDHESALQNRFPCTFSEDLRVSFLSSLSVLSLSPLKF